MPWADLNPEQREAALHGTALDVTAPPLLIVAGAGSGKTLTLAARVAQLMAGGADAQRILLMTFSRRAAAALERRVGRMVHEAMSLGAATAAPRLPWCGTFHSVGARLLRLYAARIGLARDFTVLDRADAQELMGQVRQELGLHASATRFPLAASCCTIYSRAVNSAAPLQTLIEREYPWCDLWCDELKTLFTRYGAEKQRQHLLDYDDLLLFWQTLMDEPALAAHIAARFDHVLVDEYQDTNALQNHIVRALKPQGDGLVVVGDDAQAIYAFRGADVRGILDFPAQFTPPARVLTLTQNYRSTPQILAASNAVMAQATQRHAKDLWSERAPSNRPLLVSVEDEAAQAAWVADEVLRQREQGLVLKRQAVLFRAAVHSATLELELARRRIPFVKYGGLKFVEAAHVKDMLSLLRWAHNPRARLAGLRVARLVPGIGPAAARALADAMDASATPAQALQSFVPPPRAAAEWAAFAATFAALAAADAPWPDAVDLARHWYAPQLRRLYDDARPRLADLDQLRHIAAGYTSAERFLAELALDPPEASSADAGPPHRDEDYLILSTIHSAKGQEWNAVSVLNVVDGCMPSDMATGSAHEIDEERRLLYVAMTRARDQLALMVPLRFHVTQQRHHGDRHLYGAVSRFITPDVAQHFDSIAVAPTRDDDGAETDDVLLDVAARARPRW